jgi:hypothetical protein
MWKKAPHFNTTISNGTLLCKHDGMISDKANDDCTIVADVTVSSAMLFDASTAVAMIINVVNNNISVEYIDW